MTIAPRLIARVTNTEGCTFNVVLVLPGDRYGRQDQLTSRDHEPFIEFWDATYENDPRFTPGRGQFVTRYHLSTLTGDGTVMGSPLPMIRGLVLDGNVPSWRVTPANVTEVVTAALPQVTRWKKEQPHTTREDREGKLTADLPGTADEDHERAMFGCTAKTLDEALLGKSPRDIAMYAMSTLSNAQTYIQHTSRDANTVRQLMNIAKYAINKAVPR